MKVSIVIPVYKAEKTLERCLNSLLMQTHSDWRAILIEDASPDGSGRIAEKYAQMDSRICYLRNERNIGVAATRNRALELLEEGYAAFLDSDDWWETDTLEKMLSAAEQYDADMVQCAWRINYPDGSEIVEENTFPELRIFEREELGIPLKKMLTGISMNHTCRKLVRCELLKGLRFDEALETAEDLDMSFRLLLRAKRIVFVPDALYHYYRHGAGLTGSGLSFQKKWRANCMVSERMLQQLSGAEWNTFQYRLLARTRPFVLVLDKAIRLRRDKKMLKRKGVGKE